MNDVAKKRFIGLLVLVMLGVLVPLGLARLMHHAGKTASGDQSMRVYEVQPNGQAEPASADTAAPPGGMQSGSQSPASSLDQAGADTSLDAPQSSEPQPASSGTSAPDLASAKTTPPKVAESGNAPDSTSGRSDTQASGNAGQPANASRQKAASKPPAHKTAPAGAGAAKPVSNEHIHGWVVQVASFKDRGHAAALVRRLRADFHASYDPARVKGTRWYRVNVGPFDSRSAARTAAGKLKKQGHNTLVRHMR